MKGRKKNKYFGEWTQRLSTAGQDNFLARLDITRRDIHCYERMGTRTSMVKDSIYKEKWLHVELNQPPAPAFQYLECSSVF